MSTAQSATPQTNTPNDPPPVEQTWAVFATGPSLNQADVDYCRAAGMKCIAVSDAYRLAPWADALVSSDATWWDHHRPEFAGRKFAGSFPYQYQGVTVFKDDGYHTAMNSGCMAILVAAYFGANRVVVLGMDMSNKYGHHFFGSHPKELKNSTDESFKRFEEQARRVSEIMDWKGVEVVNCSRRTLLEVFPIVDLSKAIGKKITM